MRARTPPQNSQIPTLAQARPRRASGRPWGGSGRALGGSGGALEGLWEALYIITKLPINRPSGRYVMLNINGFLMLFFSGLHPKGGQRHPKVGPKETQGLPKESKGDQSRPKGSQRRSKDTQRKPKGKDIYQKLPINRPSGRYVMSKNAPCTTTQIQSVHRV